jgi:hypothetical protein
MIHGGICSYEHLARSSDEAVAFLKSHRQFVAFITIDIGATDFNCAGGYCIETGCAVDPGELPVHRGYPREAAGRTFRSSG